MPTYEYRCPKGHHFELIQKMSEQPLAECPDCGAESERQISVGAGFLFKGDGFYTTDYRTDAYKKDASKEDSAGGSEKDSAGASEKAPAKKPEKGAKSPPSSAKARDSGSTSTSKGESTSEGS